MGENELEPLAKTRARRSNAGARMHEMIFNAEVDPQYAQAFGDLLKTDDDSSDDEEYVPKDLETRNANVNQSSRARDNNHDDDDDDDGEDDEDKGDQTNDDDMSDDDSSSSSTCSDEDDTDDQSDDDDDDEDDDDYDEDKDADFDVKKANKSKIEKKVKIGGVSRESDLIDQKRNLNNDIKPGSPSQAAYQACKKICSVCLGVKSGEDDEIIDCDACGISVHESCYGVLSDNRDDNEDCDDGKNRDNEDAQSTTNSNISSESTEPWFCEPCRRSVKNPTCELCPNLGGIFKETDTGRWVHMVCALYTRGVTFENVETLTDVSLFELNYGLFGSKACTICEDRRLARSGICIGCDAGLCKIFFHATCAQKEGLLFESHSDEIDPYFAQCKQHADKDIIKKKKKLFMALTAGLRRTQISETVSERISSKLSELTKEADPHLSKWNPQNRPPIPQRIGRMLLTSPSLILKLNKKSELMGLDTKSASMNVHDEMEAARQKWHILPAFDLEFVAYCLDRTNRMVDMKKQNSDLVSQNIILKNQEASLRDKYNGLKEVVVKLKTQCESLIDEARSIQRNVTNINGKNFNLPLQMEQLIARCSLKMPQQQSSNRTSHVKVSSTYGCGKCGTVADQHLLALCDTCHSHIHIYCLDPPLTRVPKKTKFGGWQCSDCTERDDDDEEEENAQEEQSNPINGPRKLRANPRPNDKRFKSDYWN